MTRAAAQRFGAVLLGIAVVVLLLLVRQYYGYALFHVLVELFAVIVATGVFIVTWNTRRMLDNGYLLVLGIAFLFVAGIDLLHTLAFKGMGNLLSHDETDLPTQLWLIARYLQASAMLVAIAFLQRKVRPWRIVAAFGTVTALALASVLWWDVFPVALTPDGLTPFKVASEYVVSAMLLAAGLLLWRNRSRFERGVLHLLLASVVATIASEMAFTLYVDPWGALNLVGHVLKLFAIYFIYRALVATALQRPFSLLFRELREREMELRESEERYRTTFEQATIGIGHMSLDGRWLRVNERLTQITGYSRDELLARTLMDVTHPEDLDEDHTQFKRLTGGEIPEYSLEKRTMRKDGRHRWIFVRRAVITGGSEGQAKYVISVVEDIDDRKQDEERLRRAKELADALNRVDAAVNSTLDFDSIVSGALRSGAEGIGCETATVTLRSGATWVPVDTYNFPTDIIGRPFPDDELPHAVLAAEACEPVAISNAYDDERVNAEVMRRYEIRSVLVVPLISRGECIGSIYFNFHSHTHWFTPEEMDFATSLASALALAIENSTLYATERRIATTLQSALLSMPEGLPRVDIASAYRASNELDRIGGDFYDAFDLGGGRIGFTLGDVSGKGLDAATITAAARSTIRAFAYISEDPSTVLCEANSVLERQIQDDRFVTVLYGTLDTVSGELAICSAGHPAAVVCSSVGCEYLDAPANPPLGACPDGQFEQVTATLSPGQTIVLYSDGVLDARHGDDFFGEERLVDILSRLGGAPTTDVVGAVLAAVDEFAAGTRTDDAAVAAIRLAAASQTAPATMPAASLRCS